MLSTSVPLGLVVLVAAPLIVLLVVPLLRPLQRREEVERTRSSDLTSLATDIVAGLRILRGIGGERTFGRNYAAQSERTRRAGVAAGVWQAAVDSAGRAALGAVPGPADLARHPGGLAGALTVGELVSFFGYAVFMVWPIQTFFALAQKWIRSVVSARKAIALLVRSRPGPPATPTSCCRPARRSRTTPVGLRRPPGRLTAMVSAVPEESAALADRLGPLPARRPRPVGLDIDARLHGRAARRARAEQRAPASGGRPARTTTRGQRRLGVTLGGVDLGHAPDRRGPRADPGQRQRAALTSPAPCRRPRPARRG